MSSRNASNFANGILRLLDRAGVWDRLGPAETERLFAAIADLGLRHDASHDVFDEVADRHQFCAKCLAVRPGVRGCYCARCWAKFEAAASAGRTA